MLLDMVLAKAFGQERQMHTRFGFPVGMNCCSSSMKEIQYNQLAISVLLALLSDRATAGAGYLSVVGRLTSGCIGG